MFKPAIIPTMTAVIVLAAGCSTFRIERHVDPQTSKRTPGIPFYVKKGRTLQKTIYHRTWANITFTYTPITNENTSPDSAHKARFPLKLSSLAEVELQVEARQVICSASPADFYARVAQLRESLLGNKSGNLVLTQQAIEEDTVLPVNNFKPKYIDQTLVANGTEQVSYVDYNDVYYYNTKAPLFGTADATVELREDGTLTKATSNVDNTKLGDLIPVKELLLDKWGLMPAGSLQVAGKDCPGLSRSLVTMSVEKDGYVYTLTKAKPSDVLSPLALNDNAAEIVRQRFAPSDTGMPVSDGAKTIKVDAKIRLP